MIKPISSPYHSPYKWSILTAVSLASFLGSIDGSIVNAALPTLMVELHTDFATTQWVLLAYLLGMTVLQVGMGRLADLIGKKLVFTTGIAIFFVASAICGLAPGIYWLLAFRFVQSVGASMMLSLGSAILTETWPQHERGKAIGFTAGVIGLGIVLGPILGGLLIEWMNWRWIFFVNLPFGLLALLLAIGFIPPLQPRQNRETFDWAGALALGVGLLSLALALTLGQYQGFAATPVLLLFAVAVIAAPLFWRIEHGVRYPLVDLSLLYDPDFRRNQLTSLLSFAGIAGAVFLLPFYLNLVGGLSAGGVGQMMAVLPVSMGILQPFAGWLSDRIGARRLILTGLASMTVGYYAMSTLPVGGTALGVILRVLLVPVGMALFYSPNNSAIMGSAPPERLGVASGIASMVRTLAQVVGISLISALFHGRVQVYGNGVGVDVADPHILVHALRDPMLLTAAWMAVGFLVEVSAKGRQQASAAGEPIRSKLQA